MIVRSSMEYGIHMYPTLPHGRDSPRGVHKVHTWTNLSPVRLKAYVFRLTSSKRKERAKKKKKKKGIGTIIRRRSAIQKQSCLFLILLCFLPGFTACKVHLNGNSFVSLYKTKSVPGSEVDHGWTRPDPKRDMETNFRITTAETMVLELICAGIRVAGWCPSVLYHGFTQEVFRPANYPILRRAAIFEQHGGFVYTI